MDGDFETDRIRCAGCGKLNPPAAITMLERTPGKPEPVCPDCIDSPPPTLPSVQQ